MLTGEIGTHLNILNSEEVNTFDKKKKFVLITCLLALSGLLVEFLSV